MSGGRGIPFPSGSYPGPLEELSFCCCLCLGLWVCYVSCLLVYCHCRTFLVCPFPRVTCLYVYDCLCVLRLHA